MKLIALDLNHAMLIKQVNINILHLDLMRKNSRITNQGLFQ